MRDTEGNTGEAAAAATMPSPPIVPEFFGKGVCSPSRRHAVARGHEAAHDMMTRVCTPTEARSPAQAKLRRFQ